LSYYQLNLIKPHSKSHEIPSLLFLLNITGTKLYTSSSVCLANETCDSFEWRFFFEQNILNIPALIVYSFSCMLKIREIRQSLSPEFIYFNFQLKIRGTLYISPSCNDARAFHRYYNNFFLYLNFI
jgi:hypothetical protein